MPENETDQLKNAEVSIFTSKEGTTWARQHIVIDDQGKIVGFLGGFGTHFLDNQAYDYTDGKTAIAWVKPDFEENVVYKTKKGSNYSDPVYTVAKKPFWDIANAKINSKLQLSEDDIKTMFGQKSTIDRILTQIKNHAKDDKNGGFFSLVVGFASDAAKSIVDNGSESIVKIIHQGVEMHNSRFPKNQIIWDGTISIGDVITAFVGYIINLSEIIELVIFLNLLKALKKAKDKRQGTGGVSVRSQISPEFLMNLQNLTPVERMILNEKKKQLGITTANRKVNQDEQLNKLAWEAHNDYMMDKLEGLSDKQIRQKYKYGVVLNDDENYIFNKLKKADKTTDKAELAQKASIDFSLDRLQGVDTEDIKAKYKQLDNPYNLSTSERRLAREIHKEKPEMDMNQIQAEISEAKAKARLLGASDDDIEDLFEDDENE